MAERTVLYRNRYVIVEAPGGGLIEPFRFPTTTLEVSENVRKGFCGALRFEQPPTVAPATEMQPFPVLPKTVVTEAQPAIQPERRPAERPSALMREKKQSPQELTPEQKKAKEQEARVLYEMLGLSK